MSIQIHEDTHVGLTMGNINVRETSDGLGGTCWIATSPIGSIFGSPVHGECKGIGRTKEQALERLKEDQRNLSESLWA